MTSNTARRIIALANKPGPVCYSTERERVAFFALCATAAKTLRCSTGGRHIRDVGWRDQRRVELPQPRVRAAEGRLLHGTSCRATRLGDGRTLIT